eukprot:gene2073-2110_t
MDHHGQTLWRALQPLRSVATYLMVGAHPDDEWNGFLAWLAYGRGVHTVYACSTRGEGGQSTLGPERGAALGAVRSREMDLAAAEIDLAVRWIGAGPSNGFEDPIHDFGFSRSGVDTLQRWGEARLTERLVRVIRTERPDAVSPTFLDVPGQHGHHRAMTWCTLQAVRLAADAGYALDGLAPWTISKTYLPATSGAGMSYDDEVPPPPETVRVDLGAHCPELGMSWAQWGERSRRFHASQGMGRDLPAGPRPFLLHLHQGLPDQTLPMDGLAHSVGDLAGLLAESAAGRAVRELDAALAEAVGGFPDRNVVAAQLHRALRIIETLTLPEGASDIGRRLRLKRRQIGRAAALALGIEARLSRPDTPVVGQSFQVRLETSGAAMATLRHPADWAERDGVVTVPAEAVPFGTLRDGFDPLGGNEPIGATLRWRHDGSDGAIEVDPSTPLCLAPESRVVVTPQYVVRRADSQSPVVVELSGAAAPAGWPGAKGRQGRIEISAGSGCTDLCSAGASLAVSEGALTGRTALVVPAAVSILRVDLQIPGGRVGVVAGATDETLSWLRQLDIDAEAVDDAMLADGDLSRYGCLLIGIFGFGQRPALLANRDRIIAWTRAGGSLVTMYHRPEDGWNAGQTPPLHLLPGRPSLRWRVTDPAAKVTVLAPGHDLLTTPNVITDEDWQGWVRERGLYFASEWNPAYVPLVELSDPGQPALQGALLAAPFGSGRHVHVALALHHQFRALVPGAFRLLANLVSGR